ncbi:DUF5690 family protein [Daejeonella sp. H1SJ63]|jgi:hypothetical protein|uniref:DUF5690 family protein n=1 Tax=Daejeonella sp. H1SJ63 TaxID=3034145 RepID=UPI0023EBF346|nr:DUF5690 family protein [Daejeonella sp. H1SJ63]
MKVLQNKISREDFNFLVTASFAAFITYLSMYAFRKPFTAATFDQLSLWGVNYKILLIISQLVGYTLSKYIGIKIIAELKQENRTKTLIYLMLFAWISLFLFAIIPYPFNFPFMFLNGLPLGMIWGVVFSYLEGRRFTELLGAVMASSFIVASGLVKGVGRFLIDQWAVSELWMPFFTGLIFLPALIFGAKLLHRLPPPGKEDIILRTERVPMNYTDRKLFFQRFMPGIIFSVLIYVGLTIFRDLRDNFAIEFWTGYGYSNTPALLIFSEIPIAIVVLIIIALMIFIKDNKYAFFINLTVNLFSGIFLLVITVLLMLNKFDPVYWMILAGFAMYLPYIIFHTVYFERWIAYFKIKSNIGFLMYISDAAGYLGSTLILLFKNFNPYQISWIDFFKISGLITSLLIIILSLLTFFYFKKQHLKFYNNVL